MKCSTGSICPKTCGIFLDELAFDAMKEVGPNGHFFGADHTQSRYKDAFYAPLLSDWRNFESWEEAGAVWTHERAHSHYKQIMKL